jgi:hypothetical protein
MKYCENCNKLFPRIGKEGYKRGFVLTGAFQDWLSRAKKHVDKGGPHPGPSPLRMYEPCKVCEGRGVVKDSLLKRVLAAIRTLVDPL